MSFLALTQISYKILVSASLYDCYNDAICFKKKKPTRYFLTIF